MPAMAQLHAADAPIFIVGLPRSGTTLLASMLSTHAAIDCGPETFFFARLPSDPTKLLDPAGWPDRALDYVGGLRLRDAPVHELYGRTRQEIRAFLVARPPSLAAMLESLTASRAAARGKRRWAEKTPRHLGRLEVIRRTYPKAAVIHVVRDPRDAAMSMTRVPFASDSLIANLYLCARAEAAAVPLLTGDARLLTVRYEDLVIDPGAELRRVSRFLGESFDPRMLDPGRAPADLAAGHEWWKGKETQPLDRSRVEAWRREMSKADKRIGAVICHDMICAYGYEGAVRPLGGVLLAPDARSFVAEHEGIARSLAVRAIVVQPLGTGRGPARDRAQGLRGLGLAFWPLHGADRWALGRGPRMRLRSLVRLGAILARRRLARRATVWVRPSRAPSGPTLVAPGRDMGTRVAELMLRVLARPVTPEAWLEGLGVRRSERDLR